MQENLQLLKTDIHDDGSYTEYWKVSYDKDYVKTYSSNNKLIFLEEMVPDYGGLKTVSLNKYCYKDDLDNVFFPSTIYNPSVPEYKYEVHTLDSLNRCIFIEHYEAPPSDKLIGKTLISYDEDGGRTEFYIDYYSYYGCASSTRTVYDLRDRKIAEVEYFDADAQNKARVTTIEYSEDDSVETTTILNYNQKGIELQGIRASRTIKNSLTGYFKEINYTDYEMTQIINIREIQKRDDGNVESICIDNRDNISFRRIDSPDGRFSRMEKFSDAEFKQLCSVEESKRCGNRNVCTYEYSEEGKLISVTKQVFDKNGYLIDFDSEFFADNENNIDVNTYFENKTKIIFQLIGEEYSKYVLAKTKEFYKITYQAFKRNEITQITAEKREFCAQCMAESLFATAKICIDNKIPQEYFDNILDDTAITTFQVLKQHIMNNDEIDIDVITNYAIKYAVQACEQAFKDLKDCEIITEDCYSMAIENLKNYKKNNS